MKTAVIICGVLRDLDNSLECINKYVVESLNADVFIHSWNYKSIMDDKWNINILDGETTKIISAEAQEKFEKVTADLNCTDEELRKKVNHHLTPKKMIISNHKMFIEKNLEKIKILNGRKTHVRVSGFNTYSAQYSKYRAHLLMKDEEKRSGVKYDMVFKYRTEAIFLEKPDLFTKEWFKNSIEEDKKEIFVPAAWGLKPEGRGKGKCHQMKKKANFNDTVAFGHRESMEVYNTSFLRLENICLDKKIYNNHYISPVDLYNHDIAVIYVKWPWEIRKKVYMCDCTIGKAAFMDIPHKTNWSDSIIYFPKK